MANSRYWTALSEDVGDELKRLAAKDERSVQFVIRKAVLAYLRKRNPEFMQEDAA